MLEILQCNVFTSLGNCEAGFTPPPPPPHTPTHTYFKKKKQFVILRVEDLKQIWMTPIVYNVVRPEQKQSCLLGVTLVLIPHPLHFNKETLEWNCWFLWQHCMALFVSMVLWRTAVNNDRWICRKDWFSTTHAINVLWFTASQKLITREYWKSKNNESKTLLYVLC